jgi:hypothetical protein
MFLRRSTLGHDNTGVACCGVCGNGIEVHKYLKRFEGHGRLWVGGLVCEEFFAWGDGVMVRYVGREDEDE